MIQYKEHLLNDMKSMKPSTMSNNNNVASVPVSPPSPTPNNKERCLSVPSKSASRKQQDTENEKEANNNEQDECTDNIETAPDAEPEQTDPDSDPDPEIQPDPKPKPETKDQHETKEEHQRRSSAVQRNINALHVALSKSGSYESDHAIMFGGRVNNATPTTRARGRSGSLSTANGLIDFPKSVPKSAIITNTQLNFLIDIPGVEISPRRKRGTTVDSSIVNRSTLIRHVSTPSSNHVHAIWQQKRSSTLKINQMDNNDVIGQICNNSVSICNVENIDAESEMGLIEKKKSSKNRHGKKEKNKKSTKSVVLTPNESELIEEWKIRGYMLYYKYISIGAEFEINIDYGTRNKLMQQMHDINIWLLNDEINLNDLCVLFDNCIHQMYQFCKFSRKIKQSDHLKTLVRCFDIQPHEEEALNLADCSCFTIMKGKQINGCVIVVYCCVVYIV